MAAIYEKDLFFVVYSMYIAVYNFVIEPGGQKISLRAGFEPARGNPIGFQVQRLNHSAIAAPAK